MVERESKDTSTYREGKKEWEGESKGGKKAEYGSNVKEVRRRGSRDGLRDCLPRKLEIETIAAHRMQPEKGNGKWQTLKDETGKVTLLI